MYMNGFGKQGAETTLLVYKAYIYAAMVWRFKMDDTVFSPAQRAAFQQVFQYELVLNFRKSHDIHPVPPAHGCYHFLYMLALCFITPNRPVMVTARIELCVSDGGIGKRIEIVFCIVKSYS